MSTQEATKGQDPYIPSAEDIDGQGKTESWRIAAGKWRIGRGHEGTAQKDSIVGVPIRIGIAPPFITADGKEAPQKFRVVLRLPDGSFFNGHAPLDSTPGRYLMGGLTLWDGVSFISITPNIATKPNVHGVTPTYVNLKQCEGPQRWVELRWAAGDLAWASLPALLAQELAEMYPSIYKDWEAKDEDDESSVMPWAGFNKVLFSHGYEEFTGQPEYVEFIRAGLKLPTWDANNCTDWKPVEALCEKHHAKLPAAFLDPFFGE